MTKHFGLDIGSYSIKAVQVEKKNEAYKLVSLGEIKTPANLNSQQETDRKAIVEAIKRLVSEAKITTKDVVLSLSESKVYSRVIEIPQLSATELASAINFEAEQYIPVPLNEVNLEYINLSPSLAEGEKKKMKVLLIAAKKYAIQEIVSLAEQAELNALVLETELLSLNRVINFGFKKNCLLLYLGCNTTNIVVLHQGNPRFIRTLNTAGEAITRAISRELNIEFMQAEQYKNAYGLRSDVLEGKLRKVIMPIFNIIVNELRKALRFLSQKEPGIAIDTLILSGGGALMPGINIYLARLLNLEVISLDPFRNFMPDKRLDQIKGRIKFATAVGLAIREI